MNSNVKLFLCKLDLHAVMFQVLGFWVPIICMKQYSEDSELLCFSMVMTGVAFLALLSPLLFGSNKTRANSFYIIAVALISVVGAVFCNDFAGWRELLLIVGSPLLVIISLIILLAVIATIYKAIHSLVSKS